MTANSAQGLALASNVRPPMPWSARGRIRRGDQRQNLGTCGLRKSAGRR